MRYVTLNTGAQMPMEGFGVFRVPDPKECENSVYEAIRVGYRLINTVAACRNEEAAGAAVRRAIAASLVHLDRGYSGSRAKHFEPSFVRMCLGKE